MSESKGKRKSEETEVKGKVKRYLEDKEYTVLENFNTSMGKVDLFAFKPDWEVEIDCLAVECKGKITAKETLGILREQVVNYQKCFPTVYIATKETSRHSSLIKEICNIEGAGYIPVSDDENLSDLQELKPVVNPNFVSRLFRHEVRPFPIIFSIFSDCFGYIPEVGKNYRSNYDWCSTSTNVRKVQYWFHISKTDSWIPHTDGGDVVFGINIESARPILSSDHLASCLGKAPRDSFLWVQRKIPTIPRKAVYTDVLCCQISQIGQNKINYLKSIGMSTLNCYVKTWSRDDIFARRIYVDRINNLKNSFQPLYDSFSNISIK